MKRRQFIALLLMASAATYLQCCRSNAKSSQGATILIVGAGIAGISSARHLHDAGYKVIILEGRDRIGGRIWTGFKWPNTPVDLGASWIHGVKGNPITKLATEAGIKIFSTDYNDRVIYDAMGQKLSTQAEGELEELYEVLKQYLLTSGKTQKEKEEPDISVQAAIDTWVKRKGFSSIQIQQLNFLVNTYIESEFSGDASQISLKHFDEGDVTSGDALFPQGYHQITDWLAHDLKIHLGQVVQEITYTDRKVIVKTQNGTFEGSHVIVTVPLGVLQQGSITFKPPLPEHKQVAINSIKMGVLNKTYLHFSKVFWPKVELLNYIGTTKGHWAEWLNLHYYINKPILLGFNAATYGRELELLSDVEIVGAAMETLRAWYGNRVSEPIDWQITRWGSDPFSLGSYSFPTVGESENVREVLAEPVGERLRFAGEATSSQYPQTVHGAYLSGLREAQKIIN